MKKILFTAIAMLQESNRQTAYSKDHCDRSEK
jgi:hypothetical protein